MKNIRQKSWFSITAYILSIFCVLSLILLFAETFFPNQSTELLPREADRFSRWLFHSTSPENAKKSAAAKYTQQMKLFLPLNKKISAGTAELIYRGLVGRSEFRIDVIIPQLDPQAAYSHQINISDAKKTFRLANRDYQLVYAKKGALRLKRIK